MTPRQVSDPSTWSENLRHLVDEHRADDEALAEHDAANEAVPVPLHLCRSCGAHEPCEGCLVFAGTGADLYHRKVEWPV